MPKKPASGPAHLSELPFCLGPALLESSTAFQCLQTGDDDDDLDFSLFRARAENFVIQKTLSRKFPVLSFAKTARGGKRVGCYSHLTEEC